MESVREGGREGVVQTVQYSERLLGRVCMCNQWPQGALLCGPGGGRGWGGALTTRKEETTTSS